MEGNKKQRGGARPNSGRPVGDRRIPLSVRISQEASDRLNALGVNKSEYIDGLIKKQEGKG